MKFLSLITAATALSIPLPNLEDVESKLCSFGGRPYTGFRVLKDRTIDLKTFRDTNRTTEIMECNQGKLLYSIPLSQNQSVFNTDYYPPPEFNKVIRVSRRQAYQHKPGRYIPGTIVAAVYTRPLNPGEYEQHLEDTQTPKCNEIGPLEGIDDNDPFDDGTDGTDGDACDGGESKEDDQKKESECTCDEFIHDTLPAKELSTAPSTTLPSVVSDTASDYVSIYTPVQILIADKWYQYTWKTELAKPKASVLTSQFRSPDILEKTYPKSESWVRCFSPYEAEDANPCTNVNFNNPNGVRGRPKLQYASNVPKKLVSGLKKMRGRRAGKCKCNKHSK